VKRGLVRSAYAAALLATITFSISTALAQPAVAGQPKSLLELLEDARQASQREERENAEREERFLAAQSDRRRLLEEALVAEEAEKARTAELEKRFDANEKVLPELEETLRNRLGTLGELFGVVRQVAGDQKARVETSIISAQIPGRHEFLSALAQSRELPAIADLEKLWLSLQEEMTEQGRVVAFPAIVIAPDGNETRRSVVRIGSFNAVSDGRYLQYLPENGKLAELGRQPRARYLATAQRFQHAETGLARVAIDPSRGTILSMLIQAPDLSERVNQGGAVGYTIIALAVLGVLLAIYKFVTLSAESRRIKSQMRDAEPSTGNGLGRVLAVYRANRAADVETLELRLDEAILKETSALQRGSQLIKVFAVIAPLLGLLGTVTGMIQCFQQMTLFGTGDPRLMADGISEALVTTVLGLMTAIPLTLFYSTINDQTRNLTEILEERSVGMVAEQAEALAAKKKTKPTVKVA
jgi:biopolymer transport protein ExbB